MYKVQTRGMCSTKIIITSPNDLERTMNLHTKLAVQCLHTEVRKQWWSPLVDSAVCCSGHYWLLPRS